MLGQRLVGARFAFFVGLAAFSFEMPSAAATAAEIVVDAGKPLGDASQISDFMGAGGGLNDKNHNDALAKAWRALGFKHHSFEGLQEEHEHRYYDITRDSRGKIKVGFERYDRFMERILKTLRARPVVNLGDIPRALSSQPDREEGASHLEFGSSGYSAFMPRDLKEWEDLVATIVRHNVEKFGLRGLTYGAPGEYDYVGRGRRKPSDDPSVQLGNHLELYAATWRGVKSADPIARLGAPNTMSWKITPSTEKAAYSLEQWLKALAAYNARAGDKAVGLDYVCWQDYSWASERISDGADAVAGYLEAAGFDPKTPKYLATSGWGSWSTDYGQPDFPLHRRASQIAHNIIREFNDPRERQFGLGIYYFFHTDDSMWYSDPEKPDMENLNMFRRSALVAFSTDGKVERTPMYAAFQMAKAMMEGGKIVATTAAEPLEAMATLDAAKQRLIVTVNNHSDQPVKAPVSLRGLPFEASKKTIRIIDESRSAAGAGLERGRTSPASLAFNLTLRPYSTAQIIFTSEDRPQKETQ